MLLGINTCGGIGTIALARWSAGEVSLLAQVELAGKTYSAQLVPRIQELLKALGSGPGDLEAIVVVNGPGSFTGVRIGVSSAKALAEALDIPIIAASRLAVLAQKGRTDAAALDAGRGEFYFGAYGHEALLLPEEIHEQIDERAGNSLAICEEVAVQAFPGAMLIDPPSAADALLYAAPRLRAKDFDDVAAIDGNYVRRSDAEIFAKHGVANAAAKG
jgi:tRNA threonylcarbamoyladenosine biosynthesis protein TsaB